MIITGPRPFYQTGQDILNAQVAVDKLCEHIKCDTIKLPFDAHADFMLAHNKRGRAIVRVKTRNNKRKAYSTYMLSLDKYTSLGEWVGKGFTPILLVQWTDFLGCVILPVEHTVSTGGRYDRGDPKDVEPVVLINVDKFENVEKI